MRNLCRNPYFIRAIPLFLVLAPPALLHAQFQAPTPDELKMTSVPKAPGAPAVYLYRQDDTDDENHTHIFYDRIKVLTEKGKELATVQLPYVHGLDTITDIQGRTIHADGTIVPLVAKPSDLMDFKSSRFQVNNVIFTLPSVEVGSILEYRVKVSTYGVSSPTWELQSPYPILKSHFTLHCYLPPGYYIPDSKDSTGSINRLMTSERLAAGSAVSYDKSKNLYTLDIADIPAAPDEDWMPPLNTLRWRVEFYYTNAKTGEQFWRDAGKDWADVVTEFINPTGTIKKAAAELVAPTDTDDQKARKLYTAVQKLDNTVFSRTKSQVERKKEKLKDIHKAEDVWKQQSGNDDEIALLFVSLARAAGLKVWPIQVVDRNRAMFDSHYLSARQLDDYLAVLEIDGKEVYVDPGQKMCPFGFLHWKHTLASGFKLAEKESVVPVITPAPSYKSAVVNRTADLTIGPDGQVTGSVRFGMLGPDALYWRQLSLLNDQDEVKKQFNESIHDDFPEGVQPDFDHFLALDDYELNLIAVVKVTGNLGTATGKHFFIPGLFFESRSKHPFVAQDRRATPIDVHYAKLTQDEVIYRLPPGLTLQAPLQPTNATWPDHAMLKISAKADGDTIDVSRTLAYNYTLLGPAEYPSLHDFYQKVATADQQQLVLDRAPSEKGN